MSLDKSRKELLLSVGECLNAWSSVELELANLYMIVYGIKRDDYSNPTRISYEAVISLEIRVAMLEAYVAADKSINTEYLPHVRVLKAQVSKLYKKRHEVAHFIVVLRDYKSGRRCLIRPFFNWSDFIQNQGTELDTKQITERAQSFYRLSYHVKRHVQHVGTLRALPPEFYVQAGDIAFPPLGAEDLSLGE